MTRDRDEESVRLPIFCRKSLRKRTKRKRDCQRRKNSLAPTNLRTAGLRTDSRNAKVAGG
jgi:hypothetical protein